MDILPSSEWYSAGLDKLTLCNDIFRIERSGDESVTVEISNVMMLATSAGAFINHYKYHIDSGGEITIDHSIMPDGDVPAWLPRIGMDWILSKESKQCSVVRERSSGKLSRQEVRVQNGYLQSDSRSDV